MQKYFDINESGYSVRCKLYCSSVNEVKRAVIFGHGFGGHKDNKAAEKFASKIISKHKDIGVITFNWPCHGDDARKNLLLSECDTYLTLVIGYVKKLFGTDELYGYATSFGGYLFLKYIAEHGNPFRKIALRCPSINMYTTITNRLMTADDMEKIRKNKPVLVGFDRKVILEIKNAYKLMFRSGKRLEEAMAELEAAPHCGEVQHLIDFCRASKRGVAPARKSSHEDTDE